MWSAFVRVPEFEKWMLGKHQHARRTQQQTPHSAGMLKQITREPKVTHHSWTPWQCLIYLSCSRHTPQLEKVIFHKRHCSALRSVFPPRFSTVVQPQQSYTLGALSLPPGAVWSQNIASRFLRGTAREKFGARGLRIASWWWAILLNGTPVWNDFL